MLELRRTCILEAMQPFVHIGYHKTGSTFLQKRVFRRGPGFSLVAEGNALRPAFVPLQSADPFSFDPVAVRETFRPAMEKAREQDLVPVFAAERLSGSPQSGGYDSKQIAERLAATFPEARVLMVIREQTDMLVSVYKQYVKMGGPGTFRQYVSPHSRAFRIPLFDFRYFEYHRLVGCYQNLFGAENVLVLPYELLRDRPRAFVKHIGTFADARVAPSYNFEPMRPSPSALALSFKRRANRWVVRDDLNPAPPFEMEGANQALLRLCRKVDAKVPARLRAQRERHLRTLVEEVVDRRYVKSNATTAELTGLDLAAFGYTCK